MPTAAELLQEEEPRAWESANTLEDRLLDASRELAEMAEERGLWLPDRVDIQRLETDEPGSIAAARLHAVGILGTGITRIPVTGAYVAGLFIRLWRPQLRVSISPTEAPDLEPYWSILSQLDIERGDFVIIALPEPVAQVGPADPVNANGPPGTFGARVDARGASRAILTAGHVAPRVGASAYTTNSTYVGRVVESHDIAGLPPRSAGMDTALIELSATAPDAGALAPDKTTPGQIWDSVVAFGAVSTGARARLLSAGRPFAGPSQAHGHWDEALVTDHPISVRGDSGGMVLDVTTGGLIGHVVGGYPGVYSVIQDAEAQLRTLQATLR